MRKSTFFFFVSVFVTNSFITLGDNPTCKPIKKPKAIKTASGLEYTITCKGSGKKPAVGDMVVVHYTGKLTNDTVFDSSVARDQPFKFKLGAGQVIKGWDEGIALLQVGDKATLKIPSTLGYGENPTGKIPANATLIFTVELLDVKESVKPWDAKGKDTITTASGLKYVLIQENKSGAMAKRGDRISAHYSGFLLSGKLFDSSVERGAPFAFQLETSPVIKGWHEAFALLHKGEKAKLIVPSQLAYGDRGNGAIPPKSTLIFDVELMDVTPRAVPEQFDVKGKEVMTTSSGLKYIVVQKAKSEVKAEAGKTVTVHYSGFLDDGTMFDTSVDRSKPITFVLGKGQVIKGWDEGLALMNVGDKYRFVIPSNLAYGATAKGPIPANSQLTFDVELLSVADTPDNQQK